MPSNSQKVDKVEQRFHDSEYAELLNAFKLDCSMRNLTDKTLDCYFERLGYLLGYLEVENVSPDELNKRNIQNYILSLKGNVSDETINGRIRVYRRFFNFLVEESLWDKANPMDNMKLLRTAKRIKPIVEPEIIQKVLNSLNKKTYEGYRNLVMVLLLWDGMLRKKELLGLKLHDIDLEGRLIKVFGKGRKERMVPMGVKTIRAISQFQARYRRKYPGDLLICMRNGEPIKDRQCHKIVQRLGMQHGVKLHPHLLRHSAATWYIRQGGNPVVLQGIMGHTSLSVTQQYLHLSSRDALASYEQFSPSNGLRV